MQHDRRQLKFARTQRREMVREYAGQHCVENGPELPVIVNLLSSYVQIIGRDLVPKNPRMMLSTFDMAAKPAVKQMEAWGNKEVVRMELEDTLREAVTDALFGMGVVKVSIADPATAALKGWGLRAGHAFISCIDLDDLVYDTDAHREADMGYVGHRLRVPLDVVKDSKFYSKARNELRPAEMLRYNEDGEERISELGRSSITGWDRHEDMVELWEVYCPRYRQVITLAGEHGGGMPSGEKEPLRVQDWVGPETGPYSFLKYLIVPGSSMGKGPIMDLLELHLAANTLYRKVRDMAERIKEIYAVGSGAVEDAKRIVDTADGGCTQVSRVEAIQQVLYGGSGIGPVQAVAMLFKDMFNTAGGNLELLSGAGPQSKTAAQDKMLNANAGAGLADMQARTINFVSKVMRKLLWFWWHDPLSVYQVTHPYPEMPERYETVHIYPAAHPDPAALSRRGPMPEVMVDPYSMQHDTPQGRLQSINDIVQKTYIPLAQVAMAQGVVFDFNAYLQLVAHLSNNPEIASILTVQPPPEGTMAGGGGGPGGGMPQETTRNYVRESRPGRTQRGNDMNLISSLLGVNPGGAGGKEGAA